MKLILANYLRTLRERDEFDKLLPDLLFTMGYTPLSKPQTGTRQYGVDFSAVGKSFHDEVEELLLFVIKQGDIGRREWDSEQNSVRQTLNEIIDIYLHKHVAYEHRAIRKKIILATTGDIKQDTELNWKSFVEYNSCKCNFDFWSGNHIASLIEKFMLNEHVFDKQDRTNLRKALALSGDNDYNFVDFQHLLLRQLGLDGNGIITSQTITIKNLINAFRRIHLASQICVRWAEIEGNYKQAIWICERTLLWSWHRIFQLSDKELSMILPSLHALLNSYHNSSLRYLKNIYDHLQIQDGLSGYTKESSLFSVIIFEHMGILATIGINFILLSHISRDKQRKQLFIELAKKFADSAVALISNNKASASPRLDSQVSDITLALLLLSFVEYFDFIVAWLRDITTRLDYCFKSKTMFPIGTDSLDDLIDIETGVSKEKDSFMCTSWCLATFLSWCALLNLDDQYEIIVSEHQKHYPQVCAQLWHPTFDWQNHWYFSSSHNFGVSEAPFEFPQKASELRLRIADFLKIQNFRWDESSKAGQVGLLIIDFIACRHFHRPIPASVWFHLFTYNEV